MKYRVLARARGGRRREWMEDIDAKSAKDAITKLKKKLGKSFAKLYVDWTAKKYVSLPRRRGLFPRLGL